jgi:AraC-like DNA-binding protein
MMFSTKLVPVADRVDAWESNARQFCGECRFRFPNRRSFQGSIETKKLGDLELSLFSSTSLSFAKLPLQSASPENKFCTVITQLEGVRSYSQNGSVVVLSPHDSTVIDSALPWSSDCVGDCVRLYLRTPRWLMENRLRSAAIPSAKRIDGCSTLGAALFHLANSLYRDADRLTYQEGAALVDAYFDILSGCFGDHMPYSMTGNVTELCVRIAGFIEQNLQDSTLGPVEIAAGIGISARHLHRVFAQTGRSVGEWIRERRLEQCLSDLADPRLRDRTVTDIAFSWGFCESAHFSHSFKKRFGISPRAFRTQTCAVPWNESRAEQKTQSLVSGPDPWPN